MKKCTDCGINLKNMPATLISDVKGWVCQQCSKNYETHG